MLGVGAIFGAALASVLGQQYGRRLCLMMLAVPDLLGWLVMATSTNCGMLLASRFLSGCAGGGYMLCVQVFVGEISEVSQRSWLLALSAPITALGVLTMYVSSGLIPWHCAAASCTSLPALLAVTMIFYWDTPYWLALSSRPSLARASLHQYRGEEDTAQLELEINKILQQQQQHSGLSTARILKKIFSEKKYFKPFLILNSLNLLVLLCGKFAMDYYAVEVFVHFGSNLSAYVAEMVAAMLALLGSLVLLPLVRWMARKSLLSLSSAVCGVSLLLLGSCSYSHSHDIQLLRDCHWLPITCVVSYIMATNMGLSALPNIFISEFYPSHMRIVMGGLTLTLANLEVLAARAVFSGLEQRVGRHVLLWLFSAHSLFVILFTCQYVPETRDRDQAVVQCKFVRLGKVVRASPWVSPCPSPSATSLRRLQFKTQLFTQ